jgi:hypothetical protein
LVNQDDLHHLLNGDLVKCRRVPRSWSDMKKNGRRQTKRQRPYR